VGVERDGTPFEEDGTTWATALTHKDTKLFFRRRTASPPMLR
jgi:hypothetical protein